MNLRNLADEERKPANLSERELTLRVLAWPVALGAAIGLGLAISLFAIHHASPFKSREKAGHVQVLSQEAQL